MTKLYLNVAFKDKDVAKRLGARWDNSVKRWWAPRGSLVAEVLRRNIVGDAVIFGADRAGTVAALAAGWATKALFKRALGDPDEKHRNLSPSDIKFLTGSRAASPVAHRHKSGGGAPTEPHYYLTVNYADRELVKSLGAKWDAAANRWYATKDSEIAGFHRLMDAGVASGLVDGDPYVNARIYNMTSRGVWTRTFGPDDRLPHHLVGDQTDNQSNQETQGNAA